MTSFFVSLGGNMGDRLHYLREAIRLLKESEGIEIEHISSIYETDPVGFTDQPPFLNMVVGGKASVPASKLLAMVLQIERELGRTREVRWGPRTIDIDILTYGLEQWEDENLEIPHPRLKDRLFVLIPFVEVAPNHLITIGSTYKTTTELLENVKDKSGVRKWRNNVWETELEHFEN